MSFKSIREKILQKREVGEKFKDIAIELRKSVSAVIGMASYKPKTFKKKRGPKNKLSKADKLSIKREISKMTSRQEKVNCTKIRSACSLNISPRSLQRHMKASNMKYRNVAKKIYLSKEHKRIRIELVTRWITENHCWEKTIFSDEKRFSLDGPDCWMTYEYKSDQYFRQMRQCKGSSVLVWLMCFPNGLLSFKVIEGNLNSDKYIDLLCTSCVPLMKINYVDDFWYQEDNASVHKSRKVKDFMNEGSIKVLQWPARSPDLNIVEDIWKLISDSVYDGSQFTNKDTLILKIKKVIDEINARRRSLIISLYAGIRGRLCKVLSNNGNLCSK